MKTSKLQIGMSMRQAVDLWSGGNLIWIIHNATEGGYR
jgi:hypothetical protein